MEEIWKPVVGHETSYEVSSLGNVRSLDRAYRQVSRRGKLHIHTVRGRMLRPGKMKSGHVSVAIGRGNSRMVHQLIAEAFIGPRPLRYEVRHLNGVPDDNRAINLTWGTRGENSRDKKWHGQPYKLSVQDVRDIKTALENPYHGLNSALAKKFKVGQATISSIKHGRLHTDV